ncbi:hypothetical protein O0L34_g17476 [Tuta absoluta]|nr:hypothetical protein O0L34_g17476 [Tuta absoluta]
MAVVNDIKIPDTWKRDNMAGVEWLRCYRARHPELSLKKPEACSLARATAFNPETVKSFFENLRKVYDRNPSFGNGCRVYNLDETATTTVQKPQRVLAPKGKQNISKITSGEKGTLVTTCAIVCASGQALPPALVFPRKVYKDLMLYGAPVGSLGLASASGWMNAELFVKVMEHFISHTSASPENPALLLMDNHESHLSIEAINLAKRSGVTILTLHPHTTAKMQPLDVGLNGPFKVFYNTAVDSWLLRNPGKQMTIYNIAECVGQAYPKAMTPINITSAFRKCGIFPYDPDVFTEIDFLPSSVTDRPREVSPSSDVTDAENPMPEENLNALESRNMESPSLLDNEHVLPLEETQSASKNMQAGPSNTRAEMSLARATTPTMEREPHVKDYTLQASTSKPFKSPKEFMPPLKAGPRTGTRKPRKLGRSMVATDTPEKNLIEEERKKAQLRKSATKIKRPVLSDNGPKAKTKPQKKRKIEQEPETSEEEEVVECLTKATTPVTEKEASCSFVPPLKAELSVGARKPNKSGKSMVASETQEKSQEKKKAPVRKSAAKIKRPVISDEIEGPKAKNKLHKKLKIKTEPETSGDEEEDVISLSESDLSGLKR